jgi:phospholipase C
VSGVWERLDRRQATRTVRRHRARTSPPPLPHPDLDERTDTLPQIRHIVVLMMENHSFDNYLGLLRDAAGERRGDGLPTDPSGEPTSSNPGPTPTSPAVVSKHLPTQQVSQSPTQSWHATHLQWDEGRLDGFPRSIAETVPAAHAEPDLSMGYWTGADLPFYASLAQTFPLADRWFSSCLGPTFPNRRFLIAGTAHGLIDDLPFAMVDYPEAGTIFDLLSHHGISWVNYHDVSRTKTVLKRALGRHGLRLARYLALASFKWCPPLINAFKSNIQFTADLYPLGLATAIAHLRSLPEFFSDAEAGQLPSFSIVDPCFSKFSEENPQDVRDGEGFAAAVINAVMHGPGWPETLLVWMYDEHGGYYDHVDPPAAPAPDTVRGRSPLYLPAWFRRLLQPLLGKYMAELEAVDRGTRSYDNYGFRVPAVIVSPYARRDFVTSTVHDHTSILKLVERKWNLPPLTARDAAAADPLDALDLAGPPAFLVPPRLAAPARPWSP